MKRTRAAGTISGGAVAKAATVARTSRRNGAAATEAKRRNVWVPTSLLAEAIEAAGGAGGPQVVELALREYVQRQNGRALAALLGTDPAFEAAPRRRPL